MNNDNKQHEDTPDATDVDAATESTSYAQAGVESVMEPDDALPEVRLEDLPENVQTAARRVGWNSLTPVQAKSIPYMLDRRDLMIQSRTGSGKTGAFLLPLIADLDPTHPWPQAMILVPTRELAVQVQKDAEKLGQDAGIKSVAVYGGVGYGSQIEAFKEGVHLVIGTPGRILDHLMRGSLDLDDLEFIVFDEADRMMSMGFYPDMKAVRRYLPKQRSGFMFSATYPPTVQGLAREFLHEPAFLSLSHGTVHVAGMDHIYYEVPGMEKDRLLARIIELENPASGIIFCNTKQRVAYITAVLQRLGHDADQLTADLSQKERERVLERVRQKNLRFLVATDVAARGLDISHLTHVFLYEFPDDLESYIHRAGRTGRAGASGTAISLVSYQELAELLRVSKRYDIEMEKREIPTDEEVAAIVAERTTALLEQKIRDRDKLATQRSTRFIPLAKNLAESDAGLDMLAMLLDEYYHATLHAPVEVPGMAPEPKAVPQPRKSKPQGGRGRSSKGSGGGGRREGNGGGERKGGNRRRRKPGGGSGDKSQ